MPGDVQDTIAQHLLTTAQGVTIASGYDLPEDFKLVTDEVLMWDSTGGRYPALILQVEGKITEALEFTYGYEGRLPFRYVIYFTVPPTPPEVVSSTRAARYAQRYVMALERAYMQDISRGGLADWTEPDETPNPLIWRDNGTSTVFEATVRGICVYEYDPAGGMNKEIETMEPEEQPDATEQPVVPDEPPSMEMDLTTPDATPQDETPTPATPPAPELAEPGVYVCIAENAGESPVLGVLTFGTEYDYTHEQNPAVLQAVAQAVEVGYLEKV